MNRLKLKRTILAFSFLLIVCIGAQSFFASENSSQINLATASTIQCENECQMQKHDQAPLSKDCITTRLIVFQNLITRKTDLAFSFLFIKESDLAQELSVSTPAQKKSITILNAALAAYSPEPRIEILSSRAHPPTHS